MQQSETKGFTDSPQRGPTTSLSFSLYLTLPGWPVLTLFLVGPVFLKDSPVFVCFVAHVLEFSRL